MKSFYFASVSSALNDCSAHSRLQVFRLHVIEFKVFSSSLCKENCRKQKLKNPEKRKRSGNAVRVNPAADQPSVERRKQQAVCVLRSSWHNRSPLCTNLTLFKPLWQPINIILWILVRVLQVTDIFVHEFTIYKRVSDKKKCLHLFVS